MINTIWFLLGFFGTELISAAIHRWLMHGPLWFIHESHHKPGKGFFQRNDVFTLIFGGTGIYLLLGGVNDFGVGFWLGLGISFYGVLYFFLHDMLVHRRVRGWVTTRFSYFRALQRAHRAHHKWTEKRPSESFGLLFFSRRYFGNSGK